MSARDGSTQGIPTSRRRPPRTGDGTPPKPRPARGAPGLAWYQLAPIAAVALPLVLLCAVVVWSQYQGERERRGRQLVEDARSLSRLVDREFRRAFSVGRTLAGSYALGQGNLAAVRIEMQAAADYLSDGLTDPNDIVFVNIWDRQGRFLHSTTRLPLNPWASTPAQVEAALRTGEEQVSDLYESQVTGLRRVAVAVPVFAPGTGVVTHVIGVGIPRAGLIAALTRAGLPAGAYASVLDRTGVTVARSLRDAETVGKMPIPSVLQDILRAREGLLPPGTLTPERVPSMIAFAHAPVSNYIVKIELPEDVFDAPMRAVMWRSVAIGLLVTAAGLCLAWAVSHRIVGAFRRVPAAAEAGAAGTPPALGLREANELASLLAGALAERDTAAAEMRTLLEASPVGIVIVDAHGTIQAANDTFLAMIGGGPDRVELAGRRWQSLLPAADAARHKAAIAATLAAGPPPPITQMLNRPDGAALPVLVSFGRTGRHAGLVAIFAVDLTHLRAAEGALQEIVAQQRLFIEKAPAAIAMFDMDMRYIAASRRFVQDYNLPVNDPHELNGRSHYDLFPELSERWRDIHRRVLAGETLSREDDPFPRANGTTDWVRWEMSPWLHTDGRIGGAVLFSEVVSDRKAAEQALRHSEDNLRRIVESSPSGIVMVDAAGRIVMVNRQAETIFGRTRHEMLDQPLEILIPHRNRTRHAIDHAAFLAQPTARPMGPGRDLLALRQDGSEVPVEIGLSPIDTPQGPMVLATIVDITERRQHEDALARSQEQLRQAQKMEAIGALTGGMAHDFNNLLGVIIGNLELARPQVAADGDAADLLNDALDAAVRGGDLTQRLLAFARRQPLRPMPVALNELVSGMMRLLSRTLGEDIEITLDLAPDLWTVIADPAQVEAALANLANNARDAMPGGGKIIIATANQHLDEDYAAAYPEVKPGDYAMISVSDTGVGMSSDVTAQIFEPFFTTKQPGKGTGLGLSMVFGFMKQSGGHVSVYSEPGIGSVFRLYLPRTDAAMVDPPEDEIPATDRGTGETILVVEDNEALRRVVARQLQQLGYRVIGASTAADALAILESSKVDLLFTDIVMPGPMDGFALASTVKARWPDIKVVLTSGFPDSRIDRRKAELPPTVPILNKPHRRQDLARVIRAKLNA